MGIYTKTGDKGSTGNLLGERISKASNFIDLQGSIDEVNSHIGYLNALISKNEIIDEKEKEHITNLIIDIQNALFNMGVEISMNFTKIKISKENVGILEKEIDRMASIMPIQRKFILYSGSEEGTYAHVIRSVVRRAERVFVKYLIEKEVSEYPESYLYINRLSDFMFTLSRFLNFLQNKPETIMKEWV
ncbi:cob(I)yrinic acid a,c-diamide adenosyltransferase [Desnuesiella massiliensis]|uniref:cob(I)yrinic acid a,c-diamide adenosyltransferase n=1 Tax=Desnuesiella massiliensis TaxID=1650662 RepID=UPI0006E34A2F|nr:cob(I)yrinic acid a,c-diamide adenosyltransferase [Desnuesiella massiliensis]